MKALGIGAGALALVAILVVAIVLTGAATAQNDDPAAATATREAELNELSSLRTQVAALQTQVAELGGTPAVAPAGTPVTCGAPVSDWGGPASASDIQVQLLAVQEPATAATPAPTASHYAAFELQVENQGAATIHYQPSDFVATDCLGNEYVAVPDGVEPALGEGDLAPGEMVRGWVTVLTPDAVQLAQLTYTIQEAGRTGANVRFTLVEATTPTP